MSGIKTYEYIWLDGYKPEPFMRSKVKATSEDAAPDWSFDGSSTQQAFEFRDAYCIEINCFRFKDWLKFISIHNY